MIQKASTLVERFLGCVNPQCTAEMRCDACLEQVGKTEFRVRVCEECIGAITADRLAIIERLRELACNASDVAEWADIIEREIKEAGT